MSKRSSRYLGDKGAAYHDMYEDLFGPRVETSLRVLRGTLKSTDAVLDFGCADGSLLMALENESKIGVEINPTSRAAAIERGLDVFESLAPVSDDSIDLVVSSHVLEHTIRPLDELNGLLRVIRPGGKLVLLLPIDDWRTQRQWVLPEINHHLYTWTPQLLANLLYESGFKVLSITVLTHALPGRLTNQLDDLLPTRLFDAVARLTAIVRRRRQLIAVAEVPIENC
ncbi:MAG TPA: class I SAM-dependent methyltransferase [Solirubrobacterales bacterium]|nr:class I SAM-dependent methyltransferase [Solirubrobacterales bacterium]